MKRHFAPAAALALAAATGCSGWKIEHNKSAMTDEIITNIKRESDETFTDPGNAFRKESKYRPTLTVSISSKSQTGVGVVVWTGVVPICQGRLGHETIALTYRIDEESAGHIQAACGDHAPYVSLPAQVASGVARAHTLRVEYQDFLGRRLVTFQLGGLVDAARKVCEDSETQFDCRTSPFMRALAFGEAMSPADPGRGYFAPAAAAPSPIVAAPPPQPAMPTTPRPDWFKTFVAKLATEPEITRTFQIGDQTDRVKAAFVALQVRQLKVETALGKKAGIVALVQPDGILLGRDGTVRFGIDIGPGCPVVEQATHGGVVTGPCMIDGSTYQVAASAVHDGAGVTAGVVLAGD